MDSSGFVEILKTLLDQTPNPKSKGKHWYANKLKSLLDSIEETNSDYEEILRDHNLSYENILEKNPLSQSLGNKALYLQSFKKFGWDADTESFKEGENYVQKKNDIVDILHGGGCLINESFDGSRLGGLEGEASCDQA